MAAQSTDIRNWTIYKITSPSGRVYIGLTSNAKLRQNSYKYLSCHEQPVIYHSLKKYGWGSHNFSIIETFENNIEYALGKEMFWIRSYMSNVSKYPFNRGMNLNDGGRGNIGYKHSKESKNKMSVSRSGYKWSEESKKRFSEKKKGFNSYWPNEETKMKMSLASKGRKHTEETKRKLSLAAKGRVSPNKGKPMSEEQKAKYFKKVLVFTLNNYFIKECASVKDTAKEFNVSKNTVRGVANGVIKNPEKFIFKYK